MTNINKVDDIISQVIKNANKEFWTISLTHASGPGGQNINHGNSKAQLVFDIDKFLETFGLGEDERANFIKIFGSKRVYDNNSKLILENQETRYASSNKERVLQKLQDLLVEVLKKEIPRIKTKVPKSVIEKRLKIKKQISQKKKNRARNNLE